MKTFRVRQIYKILFLALILLFLGLMVFLMYTMGSLTTSLGSTVERTISIMWMPALLCATPFLLLTAWYVVYLAAFYKMRLIFDSEKITLESIKHFQFLLPSGYKSFELSYDQIKKVKLEGFINRVLLTDQGGKKVFLYPVLFSKNHGEEVLAELQKRLPVGSFQPGTESTQIAGIWSKQNKIRVALATIFLVLIIATMIFDPQFSARSWLVNDWQVRLNPKGYETVWKYSVDLQNTLWVVSWRGSYYPVYHFSDKVEKEWQLPKDLLGKQFPQLVSGNSKGNPIVWADNGVYLGVNDGWKWIPYVDSLDLDDISSHSIAVGEQAWTVNGQGQILKINASTGTWSIIAMPPTALEQNVQPKSLKLTAQGNISVLMQNDSTSYVYLLSFDDAWKPQKYSLISSPNISIDDYFLDDHNSLWILSEEDDNCFVQKIESNGAVFLTQLPTPQGRYGRRHYYYLTVDSSGRLWTTPGVPLFIAVFHPVWNNTAEEIVYYTEANSNFQSGLSGAPVLLSNGMIWSMGRRLSSMDTKLTDLPSPLPAWFAALDWNWIRVGVMFAQIPFYLFFYLLSAKPTLFRKRIR